MTSSSGDSTCFDLGMPVDVFVVLSLVIMCFQAHFYFVFNLNKELIVLFNTTSNTMAWSASAVFLVAFINFSFISVLRTMISTKSIARIYFIVWVIGEILITASLFSFSFGLFIPGFLLSCGVGSLGTYSVLVTLYADYSTDHTKLPRVFALVNLMQSLVQFGCSFCEYHIYTCDVYTDVHIRISRPLFLCSLSRIRL